MADYDSTTTALIIAGTTILQDAQGLYNLNSLHHVSKSKAHKKPSNWLELLGTQELIAELQRQRHDCTFDVVKGGNAPGVYAHELLAVSYAGWISPAFQLKVNQAFLDMRRLSQESQPPRLPVLHDPAYQMLLQAVVDLDTTRHEMAVIATEQYRQAQSLIETQRQVIEALTKADLALEAAHTMTVEEFVLGNKLARQFPPTSYKRLADWLGHFCQQWGIEVGRAPVYGKPWDNEKAYPLQAFGALLRAETKRPKQIALVKPKPGASTP